MNLNKHKIFYIDVGDMPPDEILKMINNYRNYLKQFDKKTAGQLTLCSDSCGQLSILNDKLGALSKD